MRRIGRCRLCGEMKKLSEEHVPPRSAFNDRGVMFESMKDHFGYSGRRYSKSANGMKTYSLCESCNKTTGSWYAPAFVEWSLQGKDWLDKIKLHDVFYLPFSIYPLNVIKQAIVMMLALLEEDRIEYYEEIRRFILNREQKYLPSDLSVFVYFSSVNKPRFANMEGVISRVDIGAIEYVNAEVALPPFGYCITSTRERGYKSIAQYEDLYDISWFSTFDYNVWSTEFLKLPNKPVNSPFPLDYRTKDEVENHLRKINHGHL